MKHRQIEKALHELIESLNYFLLADIASKINADKSPYNFDTRKGIEEFCKTNIYEFLEIVFFML